jgi:hypothetical protein
MSSWYKEGGIIERSRGSFQGELFRIDSIVETEKGVVFLLQKSGGFINGKLVVAGKMRVVRPSTMRSDYRPVVPPW